MKYRISKITHQLIQLALGEDLADIGDITSDSIFRNQKGSFYLESKQEGRLCGSTVFTYVFHMIDPSTEVKFLYSDGDTLTKGNIVAQVNGLIKNILKGERVALNFISHLSGISTKTTHFVSQVRNTTKILDTRNTIPGLRELQKYAVICGGGKNHRMGLYDMVLIKDNHIDKAGGVSSAVKKIREKVNHKVTIEVETRSLIEVREAIENKVDWIMLDNMSLTEMKEAVKIIDNKAKIEASGNISLDNIAEVSKTGVDYISVGELTHSVKAYDFSFKAKK